MLGVVQKHSQSMLIELCIDYSMLSKTNVHHFAGNNVSHSPEISLFADKSCASPYTRPRCRRLTLRRDLASRARRVNTCADNFTQIELGTACGKLYHCSTMAVLDAGDSDILTGATA